MSEQSLVAGVANFRDVGGLAAGQARTRSGILFRSGNLARVAPEGRASLQTMRLRRVIDLRDDEEVAFAPSAGIDDVETIRMPLFLGSVASFFERDITLAELYASIVDDSADRVVGVVRAVVADQPVLVHCTAGKDRTGITVALTLLAAGVDTEAVVGDYARTETLLSPQRNRDVLARIRAVHPESLHAEELATRSPAPVMRDVIAGITARFGSPVDYLRAHGLTDDELVELRRVLLDRP
ncbi:tyrosine-protein phosphatase [Microbacterium sp. LRZ72]|uniref:tyrosine-protein phosphatase n=1 Tax=Microbacterium sp. LRZ72 TaxID=2942481 RepID=UPI0029BFA467|nr:tyrosine-protein phosphatase [Microbacterium sp. LRZ72]MDX2378076.1 tyrosine-protein phosphatase [Microbacterium sp. LRZ72]